MTCFSDIYDGSARVMNMSNTIQSHKCIQEYNIMFKQYWVCLIYSWVIFSPVIYIVELTQQCWLIMSTKENTDKFYILYWCIALAVRFNILFNIDRTQCISISKWGFMGSISFADEEALNERTPAMRRCFQCPLITGCTVKPVIRGHSIINVLSSQAVQ